MKIIYNFRSKLSIIYVISCILPFLTAAIISTIFFSKTYRSDTSDLNVSLLSSAASHVETYLKDLTALTIAPYSYTELIGYMQEMKKGESAANIYSYYQAQQKYRNSISQIIYANRDDILSIVYIPFTSENVPSDSAIVISKNINETDAMEQAILANKEWQQVVMEQDGSAYFNYTEDCSYSSPLLKDNLFFSASRLIKDALTNTPIGILRIDVSDITLRKILNNIELGANSALLLMDGYNQVLYSTKEMDGETLACLSQKPEDIRDGETYSAQYYQIESVNWTLAALSSQKDINRFSYSVLAFFAIVALAFIVFSMGSYFIYSHSMVRTINQILDVLQHAQQGDFSQKVCAQGDDQLAVIGNALDKMIDRLQEHIQKEYIAVIKCQEMEYSALQSQINPHFLYNVLNSISVMNSLGDTQMVQDSILHLNKLLRYSCTRGETTTVGQECDFLVQYLELQSIRYSDRLQYRMDVEPDAALCTIPKFLLQPLVENSIVHGMEPYDIRIQICVSAALQEGSLHLIVEDTGAGFEPGASASPKNVGLESVQSRLQIFDPHSSFHLESSPGTGTRITIRTKNTIRTKEGTQ